MEVFFAVSVLSEVAITISWMLIIPLNFSYNSVSDRKSKQFCRIRSKYIAILSIKKGIDLQRSLTLTQGARRTPQKVRAAHPNSIIIIPSIHPLCAACSAKFKRGRHTARDSPFVPGNRHLPGIGFRRPPLPFHSVRALPEPRRQPLKGRERRCLRQRKYNLKSKSIWNSRTATTCTSSGR